MSSSSSSSSVVREVYAAMEDVGDWLEFNEVELPVSNAAAGVPKWSSVKSVLAVGLSKPVTTFTLFLVPEHLVRSSQSVILAAIAQSVPLLPFDLVPEGRSFVVVKMAPGETTSTASTLIFEKSTSNKKEKKIGKGKDFAPARPARTQRSAVRSEVGARRGAARRAHP